MAKTVSKTSAPEEGKELVIYDIKQVNVDRTAKDIGDFIAALRIAENVYYPNRSKLLDLYKHVELDGHLTGVWTKRMSASTSKKIAFVDREGKEVEGFNELIRSRAFRRLKRIIIDATLWGLSGVQFLPGKDFAWEEIPRKHILIEQQKIKIYQSDMDGREYTQDPYIMVYGDKNDYGLMLKCSFYALIKKGNFADWAQYSEIFGQPIRVIYYDAYDDKTRIQLKQVLDESGSSLALMIPKQAQFEIMDGKTSNANGDLQSKLKTACNNEISLIILGNTETSSNENGGSNAKALIQDEGEDDIKADDLEDLMSYLNDDKFLSLLAGYGYPVTEGGRFVVQEQTDPEKAQAMVKVISDVRASGTPVDDDYVYKATGIPKPEQYEKLKAEKEALKQVLTLDKKSFKAKEEKENPDNLTDSFFNRIRLKLADFFDPAP